eukprot:gene9840-7726_t
MTPGAKKDLVRRVHGYVEEKQADRAELEAQMALLAERREQKTVEFVAQRLKSTKGNVAKLKNGEFVLQNSEVSPASLYDPYTCQPRSDSQPLPEYSEEAWMGYVTLGKKLGYLAKQIKMARVTRRLALVRQASATTLQRQWKAFKERNLFLKKQKAIRTIQRFVREKLVENGLRKREAAEKIINFLEYIVYDGSVHTGASVKKSVRKVSQQKKADQLLKWTEVETKCLEMIKKRMQGAMGNALTASEEVKQQQEKAKVMEARKKACVPAYDEAAAAAAARDHGS